MDYILLLPILFPIIAGILIPVLRLNGRGLRAFSVISAAVELGFVIWSILRPDGTYTLWKITGDVAIALKLDGTARLFAAIGGFGWMLTTLFSVEYIKHEGSEPRFYAFFLVVIGVLVGLDLSGNLITMYLFYELVTLTSMPLILHSLSKESIAAALKYLFYSIAGAFAALLGIFLVYHYSDGSFVAGGVISAEAVTPAFLTITFITILGFGTKAGMFPMHGWLPTAHPVAPAPASAVLSAIIAKAGVFTLFRLVYFVIGADLIRGTWVQYAWMILSLVTVFMGSMLALREPVLKKRFAYSTVSQVSYILFGLSVMNSDAVTGALMHVVFHFTIKSCLFLVAGAIIYKTGHTLVDELRGIGKKMPVTMCSYTIAALALIGIPPASGFISKWYLASGALSAEIGALRWIGPAVLLLSALLTAGYLLPIATRGFFPGKDISDDGVSLEPSVWMTAPIVIFAAAALLLGVFTAPLGEVLTGIVSGIL